MSACVSECQAQGEEELLGNLGVPYQHLPKIQTLTGIDLQGGIDMDLEVEDW